MRPPRCSREQRALRPNPPRGTATPSSPRSSTPTPTGSRSLLDQAFAVHPLEDALDEIVTPLLRRVGDEWADGTITVAHEHVFSSCVRAWIERLLADARGGVRGRAVLACVPGERHELGLLMLAALLRADGWSVTYLGADAPLEDTLTLAERASARVVCLSASMADHVEALGRIRAPDGPTVFLGGAAASDDVARALGAHHVADGRLRASVRRLRTAGSQRDRTVEPAVAANA